MIDPLTIAAIRRVAAHLGDAGDDDLRRMGELVALMCDQLAAQFAQSNLQMQQLLLLIESQTKINETISRRLASLEGDIHDLHRLARIAVDPAADAGPDVREPSAS